METATLFVVARSNKPNAFLAKLFTYHINNVASILQKKKFFYFYGIEKPAPAGMARSLAAAGEKEGIWRKAMCDLDGKRNGVALATMMLLYKNETKPHEANDDNGKLSLWFQC